MLFLLYPRMVQWWVVFRVVTGKLTYYWVRALNAPKMLTLRMAHHTLFTAHAHRILNMLRSTCCTALCTLYKAQSRAKKEAYCAYSTRYTLHTAHFVQRKLPCLHNVPFALCTLCTPRSAHGTRHMLPSIQYADRRTDSAG